ncbi:MAG: hypothetical protein KGN84_09710 [Acidobacteriota bacterium]|nr:hypothetical protein [Acidobacteriota bacterium]
MPTDVFPALDEILNTRDGAAALDFLIERFQTSGEYGLLFEARLMKKRFDLGLPLIQTDSIAAETYQSAVVGIARDTGRLFLEAGNIERAWPYFRAISEPDPVAAAIEKVEPAAGAPESGEGFDSIVAIAFHEGVHPLKGLELLLAQHGMCRAITAFGMQAVTKDREHCIALLANSIHREIVERIDRAIEASGGALPVTRNLVELMEGRDWLFGEWDYYVDTSHLVSVIPYGTEVKDPALLETFHQLCQYGKHLAPQFHSPGVAPFEKQYEAYDHYFLALMGIEVEDHLDYFRKQAAESDPEVVGDAPGRALVKLLVAIGRPAEALDVLLNFVFEDAPYGVPVPSALQLCYQSKDFGRLTGLAKDRGDLLSYAAGRILTQPK